MAPAPGQNNGGSAGRSGQGLLPWVQGATCVDTEFDIDDTIVENERTDVDC